MNSHMLASFSEAEAAFFLNNAWTSCAEYSLWPKKHYNFYYQVTILLDHQITGFKSKTAEISKSGLTWDALSPHSQRSIRRLCLAGGFSVGTLICKGTMKGLVNFHPVSNAVKIFNGLQSFCQRERERWYDMVKDLVDLDPNLGSVMEQVIWNVLNNSFLSYERGVKSLILLWGLSGWSNNAHEGISIKMYANMQSMATYIHW